MSGPDVASDQDFGYDPISPPSDSSEADKDSLILAPAAGQGPVKWKVQVTHSGEDPGAFPRYVAEEDELRVFRNMNQSRGKRPASLVQVEGAHGILYPPNSYVLSFDPELTAQEPITIRIPGDTLVEGMFLIMPVVNEVDLGGVQAEHGHYSKIWREKLEQEFRIDAAGLISRLRSAGLNLMYMSNAIRHWCKPPSTVIHAPQQIKHFRILLRVLGLDVDSDTNARPRSAPWWQLAWNEVRRSRGEAIQAGVQEHEIVEEQLLIILRKLLPQIRENASGKAGFSLEIPPGIELQGSLMFFKVCSIERGFNAPEAELKVIRELTAIDQWRD